MSRINPKQLHALFDQHVRTEIQKALVHGIGEGYATTWSNSRVYEDETQAQNWMYTRWMAIESAILGVGKRFRSSGVIPRFICNTDETPVKHTELLVGPFIITVVCVRERNEYPRESAYRDNLAESNQDQLFGGGAGSPTKIWAPLLHIPNAETKQPRGIFVAFPDGDRNFAVEHIDLLGRYPLVSVSGEKIEDLAVPSKRIQIAKQDS